MKRLLFIITAVAIIIGLFITTITARDSKKIQVLSQVLLQGLESWHYSPQKLNNQFSGRVYNLYLNSLDPNKRFFLKSDLAQLKQYQFRIDDELKRGNVDFYDAAWSIYQRRVDEVNRLTQDLLKKPFDFSVNESFETDPAKKDYPENQKALKEQWRLYLKYQTLLTYLDFLAPAKEQSGEDDDRSNVSMMDQPFKADLEAQAREKVAKNLKRSLERLSQDNHTNHEDKFLNAIANSFDPHTEYFAPLNKENFDIEMTGTLEGIGATLTEDGDYVKVAEIVPGSAAWRQKSLQAGDLILKVAQGDAEPVDVVSMPVNDAVRLIRGKKGTEVRLTVKKPDGQIVVIPIIRDIVVIEETYAKSMIISNEKTDKKYGYINLPSFYRDFKNGNNARNSADDVRAELKKLTAEKVNGVILDLRNNGGGSLDDAVAISGLFVKDGPVVQVKDSDQKKEILSDPDPNIVYNGPLVVLVNSLSASASEILAAALQDYGRAIIIGGPDTFGKGTVQIFVDIDQFLPNNAASYKPSGSLKFTIKKFYRINGGSTQSKGVTADIPLPDLYGYMEANENKLKYPLLWDTISAASYKKSTMTKDANLTRLKQLSAKRVSKSKAFKMIQSDINRIKQQQDNSLESLKFANFITEQKQLRQEAERLKNLPLDQPSYIKFLIPKADKEEMNGANSQKLKDWYKLVGKDAYIDEAWHVLEDIGN